ncbi:retrovirus-related pol polyprotein from transposon TNT 1-94 [Tanacetum coccineum]
MVPIVHHESRLSMSRNHFEVEKNNDEYERDCEIKIKQLLQDYNGLDIEMRKKERVLMEEKYLAASQRIKSICNYDDDEDDSISLRDIIARYCPSVAIISSLSVFPTEEPGDSLIIGDEHLDTIPEKESDELIKSSVENLVLIPSESQDFSNNESECDVPECDETSPTFTAFSNPLFDSNDDFTSSDDESLFDEDVPMENFKIYSNPLFDDEEIISPKIDPHYFNAESNLIESLLNRDTLIDSSPKFDYLLEEFSGELAHIDPIPQGIEKTDFDLEEEIRLVENLLYGHSSPRPSEELNWEIADTILKSLSPSPIIVEDSDSHMKEIDLVLATDDSMPPGIEDDDYDSEGDIRFLEELLSNDSPPLPKNESSNLDHFNDPSSPRPPPEPPDVEICFDFKPDTGVVTNKVVGDISEHDVLMPNLLPTQPTLCPVFDLLLSFSSENEDKVFNPGQSLKGKAVAEANVTKCDEEESDFSLATSSSRNASEIWLLDSASDETPLTTHGIGSVRLQNEDGIIVTLKGIRYSPKLKKNLISVGTLESKGFEVRAKDGVMKIISGVLVVMKGVRKINNTYYYKGRTVVGTVAAVIDGDRNSEAMKLWHMRVGHAGEKSLNSLIKQGLLKGFSSRKLDLCEHCINGKTTRVKFGTGIHKTQVWVYTLKTKDGVLGVFIKWKKIMETQTCRKIKHLRTDNGGEYKNDLCTKFCEDEGIVRHFTVKHTPQQNGVAERMNRTLLEKVRCMLSNAGLGKEFWAEAVTYACHLINLLPSTAIDGKTPFERWYGKPAIDYDSLHVFGSAAYYHVKESKLDPRAKKALFIGITSGIKGYRLWCPETKKTIFSRDVTFNESAMLKKVNVEQLDGV